jgi:DNA-binding MarR family transcriptional regulator
MENPLLAQEDHELWILLSKARHAIFRSRKKELSKYKITPTQALVLASIFSLGGQATTIKISQQIFREFHTVFAQLKIMQNAGLIKEVKDFPRKNRVRFVLTEKGYEACGQSGKHESIVRIMSVLSTEERQQLKYYLEKLLSAGLQELNLPQFKYEPDG